MNGESPDFVNSILEEKLDGSRVLNKLPSPVGISHSSLNSVDSD